MFHQCPNHALLLSLGVLLTIVTCASGQGGTGASVSHCTYLTNSRSRYQANAAPFKIFTRSRAPRITSGKPVEVTIGPYNMHMNFFNFTDFILYATPVIHANMELEFWPGGSKKPHLGVFQVFDKWAAGAGALSCNPRSRVEDSVGAFEERLLNIYRQFYKHHPNPMLMSYQPPARNFVSVLWWPTKEALAYPEIKFVANVKSMGNWFTLHSTPWHVNRPMDQWANTERMLNQLQYYQNHARALERRLDHPGQGM